MAFDRHLYTISDYRLTSLGVPFDRTSVASIGPLRRSVRRLRIVGSDLEPWIQDAPSYANHLVPLGHQYPRPHAILLRIGTATHVWAP